MRDILEAVANGDLSPEEAETRLRGYATTDAGRFDATREQRSGVPEAVLGTGKTTAELVDLAATSMQTTGRAILTRLDDEQRAAVREHLTEQFSDANIEDHGRSQVLVARTAAFEMPDLAATVGVVTGGTSDAIPAGEASVIAQEMGVDIETFEDVGVASLSRVTDQLDSLREMDVLIVAAGREGALPTVVAGLVDVPVIGLPVSTGYGHGGAGEAALLGMLQSCTAISVVNVDAGFTAGAQAGLIARRIAASRSP
ncbi:nickel pincer cofactor biosynthesis protein LarB [Halovenus marina]|uniref:nickel pincer cofactor biosynthesis protein LarB n=1 Tax=Halovenus marina TaxID=3396621 RepID=UPI003F54FA3D